MGGCVDDQRPTHDGQSALDGVHDGPRRSEQEGGCEEHGRCTDAVEDANRKAG